MTTANQTRPVSSTRPLFSPGRLLSTKGVPAEIPFEEFVIALGRHLKGDWGEVDEFDWEVNDLAVARGGIILSAYRSSKNVKFFIQTEADREETTVFLAEEC